MTLYRTLEQMPVLAKAGAIIPRSLDGKGSTENPDCMAVDIFPVQTAVLLYGRMTEGQTGIRLKDGYLRVLFWSGAPLSVSQSAAPKEIGAQFHNGVHGS